MRQHLIQRIIHYVERKLNIILDRLENPIETIDYAYRKHEQLVMRMKESLVQVVAAKKTLEHHRDKLDTQVQQYEGEARGCLDVGREDLARLVLAKKLQTEEELKRMRVNVLRTEHEEQNLTRLVRDIMIKTEELNSKKEVVKAQYIARKTLVDIQKVITGLSSDMSDFANTLTNLENRSEQLQSTSEAIDATIEAGILANKLDENSIQSEIDATTEKAAIDSEIERLKQTGEQVAVQES